MTFSSAAVWFEIPVVDLNRATKFYETLFQVELKQEECSGLTLATFPKKENEAGGCLMLHPEIKPAGSTHGTIVYLNTNTNLNDMLARVEQAGGKMLLPPQVLPNDMGSFAHFGDTEGNLVGLFSSQV